VLKPSEAPQFGPILRAPIPPGQEGVQAMVDISFRVVHEPGTTPFVDTSAFVSTDPMDEP